MPAAPLARRSNHSRGRSNQFGEADLQSPFLDWLTLSDNHSCPLYAHTSTGDAIGGLEWRRPRPHAPPWAGPFYARAGPADIETAMGQTQLAGRSSNLTSKYGETREQGCDCPRNKRAILDHPWQHGDGVPLWREVR
jgi:hypothetical protein